MADTTDHILNESIDTAEFYETVSSWKENSPDAALWSDVIDKINEYAKREVASALASRPAEVDDEGLPALPPEVARAMKGEVAFFVKWQDAGKGLRGSLMLYTAEQYRQGQLDAREYQRKVDEKIIARRNETIADLRFNIGELLKVAAPSHAINKDGN